MDAEYETLQASASRAEIEGAIHAITVAHGCAPDAVGRNFAARWKSFDAEKREEVRCAIQQIRERPKELLLKLFNVHNLSLKENDFTVVKWSVSGANCHAFSLNEDTESDDMLCFDFSRLRRATNEADMLRRPLFAVFFAGTMVGHSAVLRDGYTGFRHKFNFLPVIECKPDTMLRGDGSYTSLHYYVVRKDGERPDEVNFWDFDDDSDEDSGDDSGVPRHRV